jgi:uncharacterized damage-inducible protein DinB
MDSYLSLVSRYNRGANAKMVEILDRLSAEDLDRERGSYYGSLHGLFNHVVGGELFSLKALKAALPAHPALAIPEIDVEMKPGAPPFPDYTAAKRVLAAFDAAFVALCADPAPAVLSAETQLRGTTRTVGFLAASAMSHVAHHRGQVSQILDEMKVENDFYTAFREA